MAPMGQEEPFTQVGGWTAKQIHHAVLTTFDLSEDAYRPNQLRYDLRKLARVVRTPALRRQGSTAQRQPPAPHPVAWNGADRLSAGP